MVWLNDGIQFLKKKTDVFSSILPGNHTELAKGILKK